MHRVEFFGKWGPRLPDCHISRVDVQGRYKSIMAVVTSCRSDMSSKGLSPHGHLCDGRLHLVLVHASSRLQYLRFLASIPREGASSDM